ncbi:protein OSCP1-like [Xyrauchen texanus]|uniref:protein OSCP1-like n=1 Tax=Xyrauchen texanus TaxID=154827 RepID=UPI002241BB81|nr:protein OSCP1-like [Xyrauchen texanus]
MAILCCRLHGQCHMDLRWFNAKSCEVSTIPNPLATDEMKQLAKLMGGMEVLKLLNMGNAFRVNMLAFDQDESSSGISEGTEQQTSRVINMKATQDHLACCELAHIAGAFTGEGEQTDGHLNKGDDLLAKMDDL